jgi:hypothetical protein
MLFITLIDGPIDQLTKLNARPTQPRVHLRAPQSSPLTRAPPTPRNSAIFRFWSVILLYHQSFFGFG